jgi:hypothetical protein
MAIELQEYLLAQERELDGRKGAIMAREDGLATFECALGRARMKYDAEHGRNKNVQHD